MHDWIPATAGFLSGLTQVLAEQPFDTVKTRLQSRLNSFTSYRGGVELLRNLERPQALLQGLTPRLCTYSLIKLSLFNTYESLKRHRHWGAAMSGAVAGTLNTVISCPQDMLKSRLQVQVARAGGVYIGPVATIRSLVQGHGVGVFYRGWPPLVLRDCIGYGLLYQTFESTRASGLIPVWLCGGLSGTTFYFCTLPIDRVKTVMMTQDLAHPSYSTARACFVDLVQREGLTGMYRGCWPTLMRTFVGQAVALSVYDWATSAMS